MIFFFSVYVDFLLLRNTHIKAMLHKHLRKWEVSRGVGHRHLHSLTWLWYAGFKWRSVQNNGHICQFFYMSLKWILYKKCTTPFKKWHFFFCCSVFVNSPAQNPFFSPSWEGFQLFIDTPHLHRVLWNLLVLSNHFFNFFLLSIIMTL